MEGLATPPRCFFLVAARTARESKAKARELKALGQPFVIVCGERTDLPEARYRPLLGKWDAINYGAQFVESCDLVCLHDADTRLVNFKAALEPFADGADLVFCKVMVREGPQRAFYKVLDLLRRGLPFVASGELMIIRSERWPSLLPLKPCKTEDNYLLFKALGMGMEVRFVERAYVITDRSKTWEEETVYKGRTVTGIYQALHLARPPPAVWAFYLLLPFALPAFLLLGRGGLAWIRGIIGGLTALYVHGDWEGRF